MTMRIRQPETDTPRPTPRRKRGFTLTELLIATVILLIIVIATSRIFGTASKVAGIGEATANVLQEAAAIEQQIRQDFARLDYGGFFAIQSHAVSNDVNASGVLLDPNRPLSVTFRSDQLIFFVSGIQNTRNFTLSGNPNDFGEYANSRQQQSTSARIYYGHAYQLPGAAVGQDPDPTWNWQPWRSGLIPMVDRAGAPAGNFNVPLLRPTQWLLSRQAILLADDGGDAEDFFGLQNSAPKIASPDVRRGRVDIAAASLSDIRQEILNLGAWVDQSVGISSAFFYPRAEREPPVEIGDLDNPNFVRREDFALTSHVIGTGCSEFIVDWTYRDNDGAFVDEKGIGILPTFAQPWFGLDDPSRNVFTLRRYFNDPDSIEQLLMDFQQDTRQWIKIGNTQLINENAIERPVFSGGGVVRYRAIFGYNRDEPRDAAGDFGELDTGYTPWPSAVRITMRLHDPKGRLENGRLYQFVVELPRRN